MPESLVKFDNAIKIAILMGPDDSRTYRAK